jgi:O-antigen ligase
MTTRARLSFIAFYIALLGLLFLLLFGLQAAGRHAQRGIWFPGDPLPPRSGASTPLGTTIELAQYDDEAALAAALDAASRMGITWLRQELPWDAVEPLRGQYDWERWDQIIEEVAARNFRLILVLNRTPGWARRHGEEENPLAPPQETMDFVSFALAVAERYGDRVDGWQVWDEPNLMPHWGSWAIVDPTAYARFLAQVAPAIRAGDPDARVATAGLAPTTEPGGFNMSELLFLQGLYDAGVAEHFDAVALKPFGFGMGATDRVYDESVLNLDRVVLAREVMEANEDVETPVWFVEGGWAVLPPDWQGEPPPWSSDGAQLQSWRLEAAIKRAALEWPWVQVIALQPLQPDVPLDNPRRGLALLDEAGELTALGEVTAKMGTLFFDGPMGAQEEARWAQVVRPALRDYDRLAWLVVALMAVLSARLAWHTLSLPWVDWGQKFRHLPEGIQIAVLAAAALVFYAIGEPRFALPLYIVLGVLIAWRLDLGLAGVALAIPFFLQAKAIGSLRFSMVELLLVLCAFVWLARGLARLSRATWREELRALFWPRDSLDWAVLLFAIWAAITVFFASNFGVAAREFRVVVAGSVLWYWLVRRAGLSWPEQRRLVDALVLAAAAVSLYGLFQWFFTEEIIQAEGVRRIRAVYGSPNNLSLMLDRVFPVALAVALLAPASLRRRFYAAAAVPITLALFLTFSRGAWLLGLPASLFWVAWWGGRRVRVVAVAGVGVALLALLPFIGTERISSLADLEGGTWFLRLRLWESTLAMLRESPLLGVGLDNFLYVYEFYRSPDAWRDPDLSHPHQILLHFWVALGLPGLLFFFWQQIAFWSYWFSKVRILPDGLMARALLVGLGGSMIAALAHGLIDQAYFLVDLAFIWMLTLALVAEIPEALSTP